MEEKQCLSQTQHALTMPMNSRAQGAARTYCKGRERRNCSLEEPGCKRRLLYRIPSPVIRYKDGTSGEFKDGSSYGQLDLLALAEAAREASAKIRELSKGRAQGR
jgi:hypothetical protein